MKYATALEIMRMVLADRRSTGAVHLPFTAEIGATEAMFASNFAGGWDDLEDRRAVFEACETVIRERESFREDDGRQYFDPDHSGRREIDIGLPRQRMRKQAGYRLIPAAEALAA